MLALGSAIFMAIVYMALQPVLKEGFPSGLVSMLLTGISAIVFFIISCFMYDFSFDPDTGVFGWLHPDNIVLCLLGIGLVNSIGNVCSYFTLRYLDVVTLGAVRLLIPVFSGILSYLIGVDGPPGMLQWIGGVIMLVGCGLIIHADSN